MPLGPQVQGLWIPLSSYNEFNRVLKPPGWALQQVITQPQTPRCRSSPTPQSPAHKPSGPPPERHTIWTLLAYQPVYGVSTGLSASFTLLSMFLHLSIVVVSMIAALVFSPSSFSEWRQWTNSSETSALLFTLSKTHFWIWAYIIAPQTWLYNIQQCRYAKTPRETRWMRASTNHISFLLKRLWLTHLTQSSSNRPASSIFHVNLYFQVLLRKALITKDKSHHICASSLRCAHREGLQTLRGKILTSNLKSCLD